MQAIFWTLTQPVNRHWLEAQELGGSAKRFFDTSAAPEPAGDWTEMRDRWERSHELRAIAAMTAFVLLVVAVAL